MPPEERPGRGGAPRLTRGCGGPPGAESRCGSRAPAARGWFVVAGAGRLAGLFPLGQQALELGAVHGIPGVRAVGHGPLEPGRQARGRKEIACGADGCTQRLGQRRDLCRGGEGCGGFCFSRLLFTVRKDLRQQVSAFGS